MAYRSKIEEACQEIESAREAVTGATIAYQRGGKPDRVNEANRRLADAHDRYREVSGGRVRDDR